MVIDKIEYANLYYGLGNGIEEGLVYLQNTDFNTIESGKYLLDGEKLIAMVNDYETKPSAECKLESHLKYIDIQLIVKGKELIGYVAKGDQKPTIEYNSEKDVMFFEEKVYNFPISEGQFAIFYPNDLHQPCIADGETSSVRKVVIKVLIQ